MQLAAQVEQERAVLASEARIGHQLLADAPRKQDSIRAPAGPCVIELLYVPEERWVRSGEPVRHRKAGNAKQRRATQHRPRCRRHRVTGGANASATRAWSRADSMPRFQWKIA